MSDIYDPQEMFVNGAMLFGGHLFNATAITSGGNAVFYITDTGTAGGNAVFSQIIAESIQTTAVTTNTPVNFGQPVVSGDKKTVTIPVNQIGLSVLGLINLTTAPNGIPVRLVLQGII